MLASLPCYLYPHMADKGQPAQLCSHVLPRGYELVLYFQVLQSVRGRASSSTVMALGPVHLYTSGGWGGGKERGRHGMGPAQNKGQTSTWLQATAQSRDLCMAFGGSEGLSHQYRSSLGCDYGPRCCLRGHHETSNKVELCTAR